LSCIINNCCQITSGRGIYDAVVGVIVYTSTATGQQEDGKHKTNNEILSQLCAHPSCGILIFRLVKPFHSYTSSLARKRDKCVESFSSGKLIEKRKSRENKNLMDPHQNYFHFGTFSSAFTILDQINYRTG
jgi:hypothetical protein